MTQALNQTLLARATAKLGPQASLAVGLLVLAMLLAMPLIMPLTRLIPSGTMCRLCKAPVVQLASAKRLVCAIWRL